jgi:hypothetical protein
MPRLVTTLALVATLTAPGCRDDAAPRSPAALTPQRMEMKAATMAVNPGTVVLATLGIFTVEALVTLASARVPKPPEGTEILAVRVSFIGGSRPEVKHVNGYPGIVCVDTPWPPRGFGASYDAEGLKLMPGDTIAVNAYLRPSPGRNVDVSGVELGLRGSQAVVRGGDEFALTVQAPVPGETCDGSRRTPWVEPAPA